MVQLSFVLPVAARAKAKEAARRFAEKLGLSDVLVATMEKAAEGYSYFVVYGRTPHRSSTSRAIERPGGRAEKHGFDELIEAVTARLGRKIVVVGACTGSDAHTVGIDAILNNKGYAGDKGLESYHGSRPSTSARRCDAQARRTREGARRRRDPGEQDHDPAQRATRRTRGR